jgi:hypothetical protein
MKKIKLLYDVARTMKNMAKIDGVITVDVRKDQETVFSLQNKFEKDEAGKVTANAASKMNLHGEGLTRKSTTEFTLTGDHGPCTMMKSFHRHHGTSGPGGIKGVFHRISVALGILSSLKVEERQNGTAQISLDWSDVPDEIKTLVREKMKNHHACHADIASKQGCCDVEMLNGLLVVAVNDKHTVDKLTVNLDGRTKDEKNEAHTMTATAEVQFAW